MRKHWLINRRTCLKGLGVALGLPLLETMGWADNPKGKEFKFPVRLGFMYMACGVNPDTFWPTDPKSFPAKLPSSLEPLRAVLDQCLLLDGIDNVERQPFNGAAHAIELSTWLTAWKPDENKRDIVKIAPSADQIAAAHLGLYTPIPSLELGTKKNEKSGTGQEGLNNRYYTTGNYRTATQPLPVETSPHEVFKRLFASRDVATAMRGGPVVDASQFASTTTEQSGSKSLDQSMLDLVQESGKQLRKNVSVDDQHLLDDYMDSVRSLEKRVVAIERQRRAAEMADSGTGKSQNKDVRSPPLDVKIPDGKLKWSEHVKVLGDLMVLAFQADMTRVGTLIGSMNHGNSYPELPFKEGHHELSHHDNKKDKQEKVSQIDRFNIEQYAYLIKRMKSLREGNGTLLDNTMFMWGSGLGDGNNHTYKRLPTIIAGRGGGTVKTGRYVPKCNGNQGDLLSAMLARAGVSLDKPVGFGTKLLPDLS